MSDTEKQLHERPLPADEPEEENGDAFARNYALGIAIGLPAGMLFGLLVLDSIALGVLIGAALAILYGAMKTSSQRT